MASTLAIQFQITCQLFITIFLASLLLTLIKKILYNNHTIKINKIILILIITHLICVSIFYGLGACQEIIYGPIKHQNAASTMMNSIVSICVTIATLTWYLIMVYQLKIVFQNTILKIKHQTIIFQSFILILLLICMVIYSIAVITFNDILLTIGSSATIISIIGYAQIVYLFNHKLYQINCMQNASESLRVESVEPTIMKIIRKSAVLVSFHVIVIIVFFTLVIIESTHSCDIVYMVRWLTQIMMSGYIGIEILLLMGFIQGWYDILCGICDSRFEKLCKCIATVNDHEMPKGTISIKKKTDVTITTTADLCLEVGGIDDDPTNHNTDRELTTLSLPTI